MRQAVSSDHLFLLGVTPRPFRFERPFDAHKRFRPDASSIRIAQALEYPSILGNNNADPVLGEPSFSCKFLEFRKNVQMGHSNTIHALACASMHAITAMHDHACSASLPT